MTDDHDPDNPVTGVRRSRLGPPQRTVFSPSRDCRIEAIGSCGWRIPLHSPVTLLASEQYIASIDVIDGRYHASISMVENRAIAAE